MVYAIITVASTLTFSIVASMWCLRVQGRVCDVIDQPFLLMVRITGSRRR